VLTARLAIGTKIEVKFVVSPVELNTIVEKPLSVATCQSLLTWFVPAPLLEEKAEEVKVTPGVQFKPGLIPVAPLVGDVIEG
jgi:hypothetical protein